MTQNNLPDGTIIAFSSKFSYKKWGDWKHALKKPLHYGIQWGTQSPYHHVAIMCDGWLYEAMASTGVRRIKLGQKLREVDDCVEVTAFKPNVAISTEILKVDLKSQLNKKYPTLQAFGSILTKILFWQAKIKTKKMFCSKLVAYAYLKLFPASLKGLIPRTQNPEEVIKRLLLERLIKPGCLIKKAYA